MVYTKTVIRTLEITHHYLPPLRQMIVKYPYQKSLILPEFAETLDFVLSNRQRLPDKSILFTLCLSLYFFHLCSKFLFKKITHTAYLTWLFSICDCRLVIPIFNLMNTSVLQDTLC